MTKQSIAFTSMLCNVLANVQIFVSKSYWSLFTVLLLELQYKYIIYIYVYILSKMKSTEDCLHFTLDKDGHSVM